jgi:AraC family transcriptional regulator
MASRLGDDISLSEIASISGLSPGHFSFAFKQSTGMAPHAWLRRQRIDRAKALLCDRDLRISSIAPAVGFANQSAFGVAFKKETGLTPTAWRRLHWL